MLEIMVGFYLLDHIGNWAGDPGTGWDVAGVANVTQNILWLENHL